VFVLRRELDQPGTAGRIGQLSADQPSAEVLVSCTEAWRGRMWGNSC
jgi:hypothetical protein